MAIRTINREAAEQGALLLKQLDADGYAPDVALWLQTAEEDKPALLMASDIFDKSLIDAYLSVRQSLHNLDLSAWFDQLAFDNILIVSTHDRLLFPLHTFLKQLASCERLRMGQQYVNGLYVHDAYIYRFSLKEEA